MEENIIELKNVYVNYGKFEALQNINLEIKPNENWVFLGANGSGKSTLIKLFSNDLYPNTSYEFKKLLFGKNRWDISELKKYFGIITNDLHYQFLERSPNVKIEDIVLSGFYSSLGVFKNHVTTDLELKKANEVMEFLDILRIKKKRVCELSSGELRRSIIGRALVHSPKVFILDEPTDGLDIKAQNSFLITLRKLAKDYSIMLITHNVEEIIPEITHVGLIYNNTIYKQGKKEDILTSKNLSEIFGIDIDLGFENNRYFIRKVN